LDTALIVAVISGVVALGSAAVAARTQKVVTDLKARRDKEAQDEQRRYERREKDEERRSGARAALDRYRGPLLSAAWELGDRLDNIQHRSFLVYVDVARGRAEQAKLSSLFRIAQYLGWREVVRTELQLLRFENEPDTQRVASLMGDILVVFAGDSLDDTRGMLWVDEQRAVGELMIERTDGVPRLRGYAAFVREYNTVFSHWLDALGRDILADTAESSDRLRLLRWSLLGLVICLDEEGVWRRSSWMRRAVDELQAPPPSSPALPVDGQVREHVRVLDLANVSEVSGPPTIGET
jgi:hypothetical protein